MIRSMIALLLATGVAHAYPQFQLSKDQTCSACHLSPAGGGLLGDNGLNTAETLSQFGTAPEFFYKKVPLPDWLALGGDLRGAGGLDAAPQSGLVVFPMQADVYANATAGSVSLYVTGGVRDPDQRDTAGTLFVSREHWVQWQPDDKLFVRVGRFIPVFGLRSPDHQDDTRRYGGTPLYGEAYGIAVEYVDPKYEIHATGFVHDGLGYDPIEKGDGGALYAETRLDEHTAVGVEGKYDYAPNDRKTYIGVTGKHFFATPGVVVQAEFVTLHDKVIAGGTENRLIGYAIGSYFKGPFMLDLGLGYDRENVDVPGTDRDAADLNIHWFASSHLELVITNRFQMLDFGSGGVSSGYSLLQVHYRL